MQHQIIKLNQGGIEMQKNSKQLTAKQTIAIAKNFCYLNDLDFEDLKWRLLDYLKKEYLEFEMPLNQEDVEQGCINASFKTMNQIKRLVIETEFEKVLNN